MNFCQKVGFSDLHIFPYSPREGTVAYKLEKLPDAIVKDRENRLFEIQKKIKKDFLTACIGIPQEVIIEQKEGKYQTGYSRNYIKIYTNKEGGIITVTPTELYLDGLKA